MNTVILRADWLTALTAWLRKPAPTKARAPAVAPQAKPPKSVRIAGLR